MEALASLRVDSLQERPTAGRVPHREGVDALSPRSEATRSCFFELVGRLRSPIERGVQRGLFETLDAGQHAAMIAGTSLLWIASRHARERGFGFDPLAPDQIESLLHRLTQLTRQLLEASSERANA
jgi:hypothetical protein